MGARLLFGFNALLGLVAAIRSLLDSDSVAAWRQSDPIFGSAALPLNVAMQTLVAIGYTYAAISADTFSSELRWRIAAFIALHFLVVATTGRGFWILPSVLAIVFYLSVRQNDDLENEL